MKAEGFAFPPVPPAEEVAAAEGRHTALHGPAGTGKTTLTGVLLDQLLAKGKDLMVAAPTHKAVGVLRGKIDPAIPTATVASLLGLKPAATAASSHGSLWRRDLGSDLNGSAAAVVEISPVSKPFQWWPAAEQRPSPQDGVDRLAQGAAASWRLPGRTAVGAAGGRWPGAQMLT